MVIDLYSVPDSSFFLTYILDQFICQTKLYVYFKITLKDKIMEIYKTNFDKKLPEIRVHSQMKTWIKKKAKEKKTSIAVIMRTLIKNEMDKEADNE